MEMNVLMAAVQSALQPDWGALAALALVVAVTLAALKFLGVAVRRVAISVLQRDREPSRELSQKAKTLSQVVETSGKIGIFTLAVLTVLSLIGQDVTPLLASAGIAGVAIGLGAQNLIKDWLGGFFILLENQYSVDDVIKIGEHAGLVEKMDLRRTVLRALDGSAIVIPNGEARVVTNLTKEWSRVVMDVGISYEEDVDRAMDALRRIGEGLAADEQVGRLVLEPPEVLGVESLGEYQVVIRMLVKTLPLQQWTVARALRARVRKTFAQEGIEIPYPHRVTIAKIHPQGSMNGWLPAMIRSSSHTE